jgi:hypothetical protein
VKGTGENSPGDAPATETPELVGHGTEDHWWVRNPLSVWLREERLGVVAMALLVGAGAGLGAVAFRWMIFGATWIATGHRVAALAD